jgi:hypothetical protein
MKDYLVKKPGAGYQLGTTVTLNDRQAKYLLSTGHIELVKAKKKVKPND